MRRRTFLQSLAALPVAARLGAVADENNEEILKRIDQHRPTRRLNQDLSHRLGATHVAGKYHLTDKPFLLEGAQKLIELGTRVGKFWFTPQAPARDYPFHSKWPPCKTLLDLATTDYFEQLFALPFSVIILEVQSKPENGWKQDHGEPFYEAITAEFYALTAHFLHKFSDRNVTLILQHWEGDWLLRGRGGEKWDPPPANWQILCTRMQRWLSARQLGVTKARQQFGNQSRCRVFHAAEVNRVADAWKNIPTMTREVLPLVALDMVSYSAYDGLKNGPTLWRCLEEIKHHMKRTDASPEHAVYLGELGIPENEQPNRIAQKWDEWLGVALALDIPYIVHWELYCNELSPRIQPAPPIPIKSPDQVRGFWLVRPDGDRKSVV